MIFNIKDDIQLTIGQIQKGLEWKMAYPALPTRNVYNVAELTELTELKELTERHKPIIKFIIKDFMQTLIEKSQFNDQI